MGARGTLPTGVCAEGQGSEAAPAGGLQGVGFQGPWLRQKVSVWAFSEVVKQAGECLLQRGVSAGTGRVRKGGCDGRWVRPEGQQCGVTMEQGQVWPVVFLAS